MSQSSPLPPGAPTGAGGPHPQSQPQPPQRRPVRTLRSEELFGEDRELWIEHHGQYYRLRITRRGKLILQK